ncbi:MAG TPA: phosphoenolpyruvate synthase [Nitrososphaeraceae archaeon]|nr:phosphoenolpyruvate synthase [Nitrososphaeraceae archaeon]
MNHGYVIELDQIGKDDIKIAGGKGANLGQMIKFGIPVPSGFIVTTSSFDYLIQTNNIGNQIEQIIKNIDVENTTELFMASNTIKKLILSCRMPSEIESKIIESYKNLSEKDREYDRDVNHPNKRDLLCAIRSSATAEDLPTASFAGQQASFLNVNGKEELIESIKKCWASLFEPRAIFYRAKHGFSKASIAVIVQKMVNAQKSGIMFTVDPTTGDNIILIESTWGLGESIVGGEVAPDSYKVTKDEVEKGMRQEAIMEVKISQKTKMRFYDYTLNSNVEINVPESKLNAQVLTKDEILKLAEYGIMIEKYYGGQPQDIEFAIDDNSTITFVQTRAITTKAKERIEKIDSSHYGKNKLLQGTGASPGIVTGKVKLILRKGDITKIENGDIIVTTMTSPDLVPAMSKSAAIITDLGGRTCHAAIVSREMGIPAIVGTQKATRILRDTQEVTVDAYDGIVYEGKLKLIKEQEQFVEKKVNEKIPLMPITKTKVKVNIAFGHGIEQIASKADGVGLLRIEHLITMYGVHPAKLVKQGKQEQYMKILMDGIRPIAKAFNPKSVWVRMLDARTDEFRNLEGGEDEPVEANPMLGWHGIRRSLDEQELLKSEFQAIKRLHEEGLTNLQVMLPFVISVEELRKAKEIAKQVSLPLDKAKIGIMVETPASVMIIEDLCKEGIAFASFGTNDLTQLVLGIDRNNERLAQLSSEFHPAVLRSMEMVINICNRYGIETSICGESGSNPSMVRILMKYGIKSISCNIDAIDTIREVVYHEEQQNLSRE